MKNIILCVVGILLSGFIFAQSSITGKVVNDSTGLPVIAATVSQQRGSTVITNENGIFTLKNYQAGKPLLITAVGYKDRTVYGTALNELIMVRLNPQTVLLNEVVVSTGYQTIPKERATGSFETINNKLLNRSVGTDLLDRLEGVSGAIFFNHSSGPREIFVRGLSTLNAGTEPLIILDNFPYEGNINNIDPDNVESITILRDAASASIWGAKAGNGVIVITTKKGKYNQVTSVHFDVSTKVESKKNIFKNRDFIAAPDFIAVEKFLFDNKYYNGDLNDQRRYPVISPVVELLYRQRSGLLSQSEVDKQIAQYSRLDYRKDYEQYLYRKAITQQYHAGLSGGSSSMNYLMGFGFDDHQDGVVGNKDSRANFEGQFNIKPIAKLEWQTGINYTLASNTNNGIDRVRPGNFKPNLYPYAQLADASGNALVVVKDHRLGYIDTTGGGGLLDWKYRPLDEVKNSDNTIKRNDLQVRMGLKYDFSKTFNVELKGQYERTSEVFNFYNNLQTYYTRNIINRFTQKSGDVLQLNVPLGGILDRRIGELLSSGLRGQLNYNGQIGKEFQLNALAGGEIRNVDAKDQANRTYGYDPDVLTFSNVNYNNFYTLWDKLGNDVIERNADFNHTTNRYVSYFSNAGLTYRNRYIFSASVRKDASNLFGVNTNQKWNPFWSVGGAWKISDESFYHLKWLPVFKGRITYGYSGNIIPGLSGKPVISYDFDPTISVPFASAVTPANPNLRWEKTGTLNYGIDFSSKGDRISGSVDYYVKKSKDLFSYVPIDPTVGISLVQLNAASLRSSGFNIKLNGKIIDAKFKWESELLLDHVHTVVTKAFNEYASKGGYVGFGSTIVPITGKDPYALISFKWAGLDPLNGLPRGYVNGAVSEKYNLLYRPSSFDDLSIQGSARPSYFGNFRNTFSFRALSLSANISYAMGYYFRKNSINYSDLYSSWAMNSDFYKRWQKPGDELTTSVPAMVYPSNFRRDQFYNYSEATVERGDYIRLMDLQCAYNFSQTGTRNHILKNMQVYAYASNLGILWRANTNRIDPDYLYTGPSPLKISLGIKTIF